MRTMVTQSLKWIWNVVQLSFTNLSQLDTEGFFLVAKIVRLVYPEVNFIEVHWHTRLNWHFRVQFLLPLWFIGNNSKHFGSLI